MCVCLFEGINLFSGCRFQTLLQLLSKYSSPYTDRSAGIRFAKAQTESPQAQVTEKPSHLSSIPLRQNKVHINQTSEELITEVCCIAT